MQNRPELSMDISENLSKQGEALLGILQDWVQADIRFDPRIAQIIANRLDVAEHESWIIAAVMMMSFEPAPDSTEHQSGQTITGKVGERPPYFHTSTAQAMEMWDGGSPQGGTNEHPDYDRLHQGTGADQDYGALGRDA